MSIKNNKVKAVFQLLRNRSAPSESDPSSHIREARYSQCSKIKRKWPAVFDEVFLVHDDVLLDEKTAPPARWVSTFGPILAKGLHKALDVIEAAILGVDVLVIIAIAVPFIWAILVVGIRKWIRVASIRAEALLLITGLLSFLLVFRFNQAYSRWYDGRTLMGKLCGEVVQLHQKTGSWIRSEGGIEDASEIRSCITRYLISLMYCTKCMLRCEPLDSKEFVGVITASEVSDLQNSQLFPTSYIINIIRTAIFHAAVDKNLKSTMSNGREGSIESSLSLIDRHIADCVRIRCASFPITYTYVPCIAAVSYVDRTKS